MWSAFLWTSAQGPYQGSPMSGEAWSHLPPSLPPLSLLDWAAVPLLLSIDPKADFSLKRWGFEVGTGSFPAPSQACEQRKLRKPPLYFAFLPRDQFA